MNTNRVTWLAPLLTTLAGMGACEIQCQREKQTETKGPPRITSAELCSKVDGDKKPVDPRGVFEPTVERIRAVIAFENLPESTVLKAEWAYLGDKKGDKPRELPPQQITVSGDGRGVFTIRNSGKPWPVGRYGILLYVNGKVKGRASFRVRDKK